MPTLSRRSFAGALAAVLAAIGLHPSSLAVHPAAVPDHPLGRNRLSLHLRSTRDILEFPMDRGEYLVVTYDDAWPNPMLATFEDCTESELSPKDLRVIARGLRDGSLVCARQPSPDEMLHVLEAQMAAFRGR
jgi:hypothetical protein